MGIITYNEKKYIEGGKIPLKNGDSLLTLVNPESYHSIFKMIVSYRAGEYQLRELPDSLANILDIKKEDSEQFPVSLEIKPNIENKKEEIKAVPEVISGFQFAKEMLIKFGAFGIITIMTTVGANYALEKTTPYNLQIVTSYAASNIGDFINTNKDDGDVEAYIANLEKRIQNSPYKKEYEEIVIPFFRKTESTFSNVKKPGLKNIESINIIKYGLNDANKGKLLGALARYDFITNTLYLPNDEVLAAEKANYGDIDVEDLFKLATQHEAKHSMDGSFSENIITNFLGISLDEGMTALTSYEINGGYDTYCAYIPTQCMMKAFQEIVGPDVMEQYSFDLNTNTVVNDLSLLYGNKLDAVKLISSMDTYHKCALNYKEQINYRQMKLDIINQLSNYEYAKLAKDIQNNVYPLTKEGLRNFVGQVEYLGDVNNSFMDYYEKDGKMYCWNDTYQQLLDKERNDVEEGIYAKYAVQYGIDINVLKDMQASFDFSTPSRCYYNKDSKYKLPITYHNKRAEEKERDNFILTTTM